MVSWFGTDDRARWPQPLRDYLDLESRFSRQQSLDETRFVVFDCETTGLDLEQDELLAVSAVALQGRDLQMDDRFEVMVRQDGVGGAEAAQIHGLVSRDVARGLEAEQAALRFVAYARDAVLVGHHVRFDVTMVNRSLRKVADVQLWNPVVDTGRLYQRLESGPMPDPQQNPAPLSLEALAGHLNVPIFERHTASGDALATAEVFQVLLAQAGRRGIRTVADLLKR